ncbi:hypothetical protein Anapl_16941 [Anas platyrhynchos]|uniref:Uncharacterized protein n=1 Tax=Anas platyrhynchos TaxID=8839 RepID=R0LSE9_ANAPL|nr:hypothetical protein Anapl_16941 [Anas platyrhynchos]
MWIESTEDQVSTMWLWVEKVWPRCVNRLAVKGVERSSNPAEDKAPCSLEEVQHFGSWQAGRKEIIWTEEEGAKKLKWEVKQEDMQTNEGSRVENGHWKCKEEGHPAKNPVLVAGRSDLTSCCRVSMQSVYVGILQQNLQWQNIDSERAEIIKENH